MAHISGLQINKQRCAGRSWNFAWLHLNIEQQLDVSHAPSYGDDKASDMHCKQRIRVPLIWLGSRCFEPCHFLRCHIRLHCPSCDLRSFAKLAVQRQSAHTLQLDLQPCPPLSLICKRLLSTVYMHVVPTYLSPVHTPSGYHACHKL